MQWCIPEHLLTPVLMGYLLPRLIFTNTQIHLNGSFRSIFSHCKVSWNQISCSSVFALSITCYNSHLTWVIVLLNKSTMYVLHRRVTKYQSISAFLILDAFFILHHFLFFSLWFCWYFGWRLLITVTTYKVATFTLNLWIHHVYTLSYYLLHRPVLQVLRSIK